MVGQGKGDKVDSQIHSLSGNISRLLRIYLEVEEIRHLELCLISLLFKLLIVRSNI